MATIPGIIFLQQLDEKTQANYARGADFAEAKRNGAIAYGITVDDVKNRNHNIRCIYAIDEFTINEFGGDQLYRMDTANTRGLCQPLVKISERYSMIYFMFDDSVPIFEKRGHKWQYLIVIDQSAFTAAQEWHLDN